MCWIGWGITPGLEVLDKLGELLGGCRIVGVRDFAEELFVGLGWVTSRGRGGWPVDVQVERIVV